MLRLVLLPLLTAPLCACKADRPAPAPPGYRSVLVKRIGHVHQRPGLGGQACAEMVIQAAGWPMDQRDLFRLSKPDRSPAAAYGCYARSLARTLEQVGVEARVTSRRADERSARRQWRALHAGLAAGRPSIVCTTQRSEARGIDVVRFRAVFGYDARSGSVRYHDPARADGADRRQPLRDFLRSWVVGQGQARRRVRIELTPPRAPARPSADAVERRAALRRARALRAALPAAFTVVAEPPFVVIGDEPPGRVRARARSVVRWAVARLRADLFAGRPSLRGEPTQLWLFRDGASYRAHAAKRFGVVAPPPYGFHSPRHRALAVNIALGRGSVVHELVHTFVAAYLPGCPPWFNEGLGALYEASSERGGRIRGHVNWRLSGLKTALRLGQVMTIKELTALGPRAFVEQERRWPHTAYSEAQALCLHLQHEGKLRAFIDKLGARRGRDPTGYEALTRVLQIPDAEALERRFRRFVVDLHDSGGGDPDLGPPPGAGAGGPVTPPPRGTAPSHGTSAPDAGRSGRRPPRRR